VEGSPRFSVSVASKRLSDSVSLLSATLAWRSINVAAKGLKARVGSNQWTAVSQGIHRKPKSGGDKMARIGFDIRERIARLTEVVKCFALNGRN
jgi:hypothetical protein